MNDSRDTLAIVDKLQPASAVDDSWPATARAAALQQLLASVADPTPSERVRPPRRRRIVLAAGLAAALVVSSANIAAAAGLLPESLTNSLSFWATQTDGAVDVQTARRVAQAPGPDGSVLSVWSATSQDGTTCIAPLFESPGDLDRPAPADFELAGGECTPVEGEGGPFSMGGSEDGRGTHVMWANLGDAVRAELRLPDGTVRPVLPAEGMFFFWYVANAHVDPPTLVGYDGTGAVVEERPLPNLRD